jgi:FMN-dependent NADH-azoreductase
MTNHVLQIDSSIFGDQGQSSQLTAYLVATLKRQQLTQVTYRNLAAEPLPHLTGATLVALSTDANERTPEQAATVAMADALIAELQAANTLVLAAPMYNFAVPSTLKAWMDYVARAGVTFRYTANGPEGLLTHKKAYVVSTRGGLHQGKVSDSQTAFVNTFLNFIGITDVVWIYAEGINMGEFKAIAIDQAKAQINAVLEI